MKTRSDLLDGNRVKTAEVESTHEVKELFNLFPAQMLSNYEISGLVMFLIRKTESEPDKDILWEVRDRLLEDEKYVRKPEKIKPKFKVGDVVEVRVQQRIFKDWFKQSEFWVPATIVGHNTSDRHARYRVKQGIWNSWEFSGYGIHESDIRIAVNPPID